MTSSLAVPRSLVTSMVSPEVPTWPPVLRRIAHWLQPAPLLRSRAPWHPRAMCTYPLPRSPLGSHLPNHRDRPHLAQHGKATRETRRKPRPLFAPPLRNDGSGVMWCQGGADRFLLVDRVNSRNCLMPRQATSARVTRRPRPRRFRCGSARCTWVSPAGSGVPVGVVRPAAWAGCGLRSRRGPYTTWTSLLPSFR